MLAAAQKGTALEGLRGALSPPTPEWIWGVQKKTSEYLFFRMGTIFAHASAYKPYSGKAWISHFDKDYFIVLKLVKKYSLDLGLIDCLKKTRRDNFNFVTS